MGRPISVKSEPPANNTYNNMTNYLSGLYSNKDSTSNAEGI